MKKIKKIATIFGISLSIILLTAIIPSYSSSYDIPSWVKGVANFWVEGNISDNEFGEAITFLIEQEILRVEMPNTADNSELQNKINQLESDKARLQNEITQLKGKNSQLQNELDTIQKSSSSNIKSESGFSNMSCNQDSYGFVTMTGKFTNGKTPYSSIYFKLAIIGSDGTVLATGIGTLSNVGAFQTKIFDATADYSGSFASCEIEIDSAFQ